ncbi:MAG: M23 family peptidase, partial [Bradymonadaceae bacterium]
MNLRHFSVFVLTLLVTALWNPGRGHAEFTYNSAGDLVSGSGQGRVDENIYVPAMRFPIEAGPAYANSQVWGRGGMNGGGGSQCDAVNYSYPWRDNYCETRGWEMPLCPTGTGHQGQDIRAATCEANKHWAVAADAGEIIQISSYILYLYGDDDNVYSYLHLEP